MVETMNIELTTPGEGVPPSIFIEFWSMVAIYGPMDGVIKYDTDAIEDLRDKARIYYKRIL